MKNSIIREATIKEMDAFEQSLELPAHEYQVYLSAISFETTNVISAQDVGPLTQRLYDKLDIRGTFPLIPFSHVQEKIRDAVSRTLADGIVGEVSTDTSFIEKREYKFWQIIVPYFPLPPTSCFEYDYEKGATSVEEEPYYTDGTWWDFFFILCRQNKGLLLEGAAFC